MTDFHYVTKQISDVSAKDTRVSIVGRIADVGEGSFVLDDDTGKIQVQADAQVEKNKMIRVFCSVIDEKLKADVIQSVDGIDLVLFKKVKELYNLSGV
jgi:uncharacterized protein YdeI (BOF family)